MTRPLWLHIDGGLLMAIGDYVLTEDVNADRSLFFLLLHLQTDYTGKVSHYLEVTSILPKHKQISFFLRSVSKAAAQYSKN